MDNQYEFLQKVEKKKWIKKFIFLFVIVFIILPLTLFFAFFFISKPIENFPMNEYFDIQKGMTVNEIGEYLEEQGVIRSILIFNLYNKIKNITDKDFSEPQAGKYIFKKKLNIFQVYDRLAIGESGIELVRIIIQEGLNNNEIANIIKNSKKIIDFDDKMFLNLAKNDEGFLYPDTYEFSPFDTEQMIINEMKDNFNNRTKKVVRKIKNSNKSLQKIIIMASLIEEEAGNASVYDKKEVSGILWNRLKKGMLLQVDATFSYIYKRHLSKVKYSDLKVKSPYNTYKNKGLPPTPISNPTLKSLEAALYPNRTDKIFYLTGLDGKFYYSKKYNQHLNNKKKYIVNYKKK